VPVALPGWGISDLVPGFARGRLAFSWREGKKMTTEQNGISRRSFLTTASALAVGAGIARLPGTAEAADALPTLPWTQYYPTAGLDVEAVREAAYCLNFGTPGGCGYAASQVLINALMTNPSKTIKTICQRSSSKI
jgi:hypothetical protein